jgi:hypothetical protein
MAGHEAASQKKQVKEDQNQRVRQKEARPSSDRFHSWEPGALPVGVGRFSPRTEEHAELLSMAQSSDERANLALQLQQTYGNDYVQKLVARVRGEAHLDMKPGAAAQSGSGQADSKATESTERSSPQHTSEQPAIRTMHNRKHFSAVIRRVDRPGSSKAEEHHSSDTSQEAQPLLSGTYADEMTGQAPAPPPDLASMTAEMVAAVRGVEVREPEEGESVALPEITAPAKAANEELDAVSSKLTWHSTFSLSGAAPSGFGITRPNNVSMTGITVTQKAGTYTVEATVDNPVTYQARAAQGPGGQVDIPSESSAAITGNNYATVASDLTPNMADLNGRPPRTQFWARDLTIRHELYHCTDWSNHASSGVVLAQNWLNGQSASSVAEVQTLLAKVPGRVAQTGHAAMAYPGREERAYGDGAPVYTARANAVKAKGDKGEYP